MPRFEKAGKLHGGFLASCFCVALTGGFATYPVHAESEPPVPVAPDWRQQVSEKLTAAKHCPARQEENVSGALDVMFAVAADGRAGEPKITKTSGVVALDQEALAMVKRSDPFSPPPEGKTTYIRVHMKLSCPDKPAAVQDVKSFKRFPIPSGN